MVVHGTILLGLDFSIVEDVLPLPDRRPEYREARGHTEFMRNLKVKREDVKQKLREVWNAEERASAPPAERMKSLLEQRYSRESWTKRR